MRSPDHHDCACGWIRHGIPPSAPYYTYDFRTTEGPSWIPNFGISQLVPNGMVSRRQVNGNYVLSSTSWLGEISNVLGDASPALLKLK
ncbi:MAG: hypothetical protein IPP34_09435 [Bacteroidetes bacterium]|nr:hypothetical protein [Bacteroidota bacterium]